MLRALACALAAIGVACAGSVPGTNEPRAENAVVRPVPPGDLDQRLIQLYPLRGQVLSENGFARVRFTVAPNGAVTADAEPLKATHAAYATACRSMLEASTWQPARDAQGQPVAYTGTFDCAFEHPAPLGPRTTLDVTMNPPLSPDYGEDWFQRYGGTHIGGNSEAALQIEVHVDGRVSVLGAAAGANPEVAAACRRMLEEGPRWQPATDRQGRPVPFEGSFQCRVYLETQHKQLVLGDVGATGPVPVEDIASSLTEHLTAFTHCFESAFGMSKKVHGRHWLAFEILPSGAVGRLEWVERADDDELLETCLFSALRALRFPAAQATTLADAQLDAGGVAKLTRSL